MRRSEGTSTSRRRSWTLYLGVLLGVLLAAGSAAVPTSPARGIASAPAFTPLVAPAFNLSDNGSVETVVDGMAYWLNDTIVPGTFSPNLRSYTIEVTATAPLAAPVVNLATNAVFAWSGPQQLPGGSVNLPPLSNWSWVVISAGTNDSSHWSTDGFGTLNRTIPWESAAFTVTGIPRTTVHLAVNPSRSDGTTAPGFGFVDSGPVPQNDPAYTAAAAALAPAIVRWSQTYAAPATWYPNGTVSFDLDSAASVMNLTAADGAAAFVSIPAGTWGDGNSLPAGMPLNTSLVVDWTGHATGYFPATTAYATYLSAFVRATIAQDWTIRYWNIGNEVPVANMTEAAAFAVLFNAAAGAIHHLLPAALVGSDVLLVPSKIPLFASELVGVGFLAYHAYPAEGLCNPSSTFCAPTDQNNYNRDARVLEKTAGFGGFAAFASPRSAQWAWYNATGQWLPVIEAETNLNSGQTNGTDPRQQTLFDAAWYTDSLVQAAEQNVSASLFYTFQTPYPLPPSATSFYGGWGFGMTAQTANGSVVDFPSYDAAELWSNAFPAGVHGLRVANSVPGEVASYAARSGRELSVVVANLVGAETNVTLTLGNGSWHASSFARIDGSTYATVFSPTLGEQVLPNSSMRTVAAHGENGTLTCPIFGYGVIAVTYTTAAPWNATNGTSNGTTYACPDGPATSVGTTSSGSTGPGSGSGTGVGGSPPTVGDPPGSKGGVPPPPPPTSAPLPPMHSGHSAGTIGVGVSPVTGPAPTAWWSTVESSAVLGVIVLLPIFGALAGRSDRTRSTERARPAPAYRAPERLRRVPARSTRATGPRVRSPGRSSGRTTDYR